MEETKKTHVIHITHNDADAVGCAIVAANLFPETDIVDNTHFCVLGTQEQVITDLLNDAFDNNTLPDMIVFSDISMTESFTTNLEEICAQNKITLVGYDHHPTNHLDEKHPWYNVISDESQYSSLVGADTLVSATWIMCQVLIRECQVPEIFIDVMNMISRYDTWTWRKYPYDWSEKYGFLCDELIAQICKQIGPEQTFKDLLPYYMIDDNGQVAATAEKAVPDHYYVLYDLYKRGLDQYLKTLNEKCRITEMNDLVFALIPFENNYANAACEYVYNNFDYVDVVAVIYLSSNKIGLRTGRDNIDLGQMASTWKQGGGHKKAAGATIPPTEMVACAASYLLNSVPLGKYEEWVVKTHVEENDAKSGEDGGSTES
jgi:oligoribonuclease NrnB/cAMP/cGMP phosphodiesterase (DHH superfamily)